MRFPFDNPPIQPLLEEVELKPEGLKHLDKIDGIELKIMKLTRKHLIRAGLGGADWNNVLLTNFRHSLWLYKRAELVKA